MVITKITEKEKSRDHTEKMLIKNSSVIKINRQKKKGNYNFWKKKLKSHGKIKVPGDPSSAAFFCALAILKKGSSLIIKNVGLNPNRTGFYKLLKKQGAKLKIKNIKKINNEVTWRYSCKIFQIKTN